MVIETVTLGLLDEKKNEDIFMMVALKIKIKQGILKLFEKMDCLMRIGYNVTKTGLSRSRWNHFASSRYLLMYDDDNSLYTVSTDFIVADIITCGNEEE